MKGQVGAWAPRQPQWQHWGELADVGQGAEETAEETGTAPMEGVDASGFDDDATECELQMVADADECMMIDWLKVRGVGGGGERGVARLREGSDEGARMSGDEKAEKMLLRREVLGERNGEERRRRRTPPFMQSDEHRPYSAAATSVRSRHNTFLALWHKAIVIKISG